MAQSMLGLMNDALPQLRYVLAGDGSVADTDTTGADTTGVDAPGAAFGLDDPDLDGYVVFDFEPFDWWEEDQPLVGHPRDPMHRIDVCPSSRTIRVEHRGTVLAETGQARLLFEGTFPMPRYYLPRSALRVPLVRGRLQTTCAYKGHVTHCRRRDGGPRPHPVVG